MLPFSRVPAWLVLSLILSAGCRVAVEKRPAGNASSGQTCTGPACATGNGQEDPPPSQPLPDPETAPVPDPTPEPGLSAGAECGSVEYEPAAELLDLNVAIALDPGSHAEHADLHLRAATMIGNQLFFVASLREYIDNGCVTGVFGYSSCDRFYRWYRVLGQYNTDLRQLRYEKVGVQERVTSPWIVPPEWTSNYVLKAVSGAIFLAHGKMTGSHYEIHLEKRRTSDLSLVATFGTGGVAATGLVGGIGAAYQGLSENALAILPEANILLLRGIDGHSLVAFDMTTGQRRQDFVSQVPQAPTGTLLTHTIDDLFALSGGRLLTRSTAIEIDGNSVPIVTRLDIYGPQGSIQSTGRLADVPLSGARAKEGPAGSFVLAAVAAEPFVELRNGERGPSSSRSPWRAGAPGDTAIWWASTWCQALSFPCITSGGGNGEAIQPVSALATVVGTLTGESSSRSISLPDYFKAWRGFHHSSDSSGCDGELFLLAARNHPNLRQNDRWVLFGARFFQE